MAKDDILLNHYSSVVKYVQEAVSYFRALGFSDNVTFRDMDGHAENEVLPNEDFVCLKDFSGTTDENSSDWVFQIGVTTFEDENLFRHRAMMNYLMKKFIPLQEILVYDNEDKNTSYGRLIVKSDTTLQPFSKVNARAIQYLLVGASSTVPTL